MTQDQRLAEELKLVLDAIEAACRILLAVKPILDGIIKSSRR